MAVQGTIVTMGNLTATNAYLRISDITTKKIIDTTSDNNGKWQMTYGVDCYVSADERAEDSPVKLVAPSVDRFKVVSDDEPTDPMNVAYANLKTQSTVSNPSDLV
jgi:hypothetical protein